MVGENLGEWGVPEVKKNFKKEGAVIGVRSSGDIKTRRSENLPLDLTQQSRAGEKSIDTEKEAGKPRALRGVRTTCDLKQAVPMVFGGPRF